MYSSTQLAVDDGVVVSVNYLKELFIDIVAGVVKMADTHDSGSCDRKVVGVQIPSPAPELTLYELVAPLLENTRNPPTGGQSRKQFLQLCFPADSGRRCFLSILSFWREAGRQKLIGGMTLRSSFFCPLDCWHAFYQRGGRNIFHSRL